MKYSVSSRDQYKAYLLHIKPRKVYAVLGMVFMLIALFVIYLELSRKGFGKTSLSMIVAAIYVLFSIYIWPMYSMNKLGKQTKLKGGEIDLFLDKDFFTRSTEMSNAKMLYKDIFKLKKNKNYLLIYINDGLYIILPKRNSELQDAAKQIEENFTKNS
ncbi:MAG: YcxB family protein [Planctomycetaceae bacterium]|nr:YcxB family protein [Planctomycetaceae bacterium]